MRQQKLHTFFSGHGSAFPRGQLGPAEKFRQVSAGSESPGGTEEGRLHSQDRREDEGDEGPQMEKSRCRNRISLWFFLSVLI